MLRSFIARAALACSFCLAFCAQATPAAPTLPAPASTVDAHDREIGRRVDARLDKEPALGRVEASVVDGVALLHGEVVRQEDAKLAESIAAQTRGVTRVENRIELSTRLSDRFGVALQAVGDKLVRLLAATPLLVIAVGIVFAAAWIGRVLSRRTRWWLGHVHSQNPYLEGLVQRVVQWLTLVCGLLIALDLLGASSLVGAVLGSAGVAGLVLGFAFKDIAENYVAGILLSLRRPFAPGDHVLIDRVHEGKVVALTSRATLLMTLDGNQLALPNALVFRSVVLNFSENPKRRFDFLVPLDPSASVSDAQRIGLAAMQGIDGLLADPPPYTLITEYLPDRMSVQFLGWVDQKRTSVPRVRSEGMRRVKRALDDAGIRRAGVPVSAPKPAVPDYTPPADTSADREIDAQLAQAQRAKDAENLLDDRDTPPSP
ncbi:mechanosensitive ion channel [Lysobacter sp. KIS68-7]|uniref:mechanosensitive ion channel family protein n=1 Tax=Lysobacter sp. KIS68-7 TaxID=2904252 RepID=UPI001E585942|nr:mechanosensitive ion channel family protein [Lysobacter sp. KIS68-7]UHQ19225.1 mechanosensitive ion channel [Lysobacter sp. KIS68-7]